MTLSLFPKSTLQDFRRSCTPLANIPSLENRYEQRVMEVKHAVFSFHATDDDIDALARFLRTDQDFLGIILALTNISQEKFLRLLTAQRYTRNDFGKEWTIKTVQRKIANDDDFVVQLARLFLEGQQNSLVAHQVARFYLNQIRLPANWREVLRDDQILTGHAYRKLAGEYNDAKGDAVEAIIRHELDAICDRYGFEHSKGQVPLVGKEVDHVLPSRDDPYVMIMTSYMETTSSSQTARANEQREMYLAILNDNQRYGRKRVLVNFVDGAGWLARDSDLRKLHDSCDYILNLNTVNRLEAIICRYMPARYFTPDPKPQVEDAS
jgi:primosomal protein N''